MRKVTILLIINIYYSIIISVYLKSLPSYRLSIFTLFALESLQVQIKLWKQKKITLISGENRRSFSFFFFFVAYKLRSYCYVVHSTDILLVFLFYHFSFFIFSETKQIRLFFFFWTFFFTSLK